MKGEKGNIGGKRDEEDGRNKANERRGTSKMFQPQTRQFAEQTDDLA